MKKAIFLGSFVALSLVFVVSANAQTDDEVVEVKCGFFAKLLGRCDQTANVLDSMSSTSRPIKGEMQGNIRKDMKVSSTTTAEMIKCVGSAVATREASLSGGFSTFSTSINSAYTKRASDLASAYSQTTGELVKSGVKSAWNAFASTTKSAKKTWKSTKDTAWKTFKTSVKACNPSTSITDSSNASKEVIAE